MKIQHLLLLSSLFLGAIIWTSGCGKRSTAEQASSLKTFIAQADVQTATDTLMALLRNTSKDKQASELALLLATVYAEKAKDSESELSVYQAIALAFPNTDAVRTAVEKLPDSIPPLAERISQMQGKIYDPTQLMADPALVNSYLRSSMVYAALLPKDPATEQILYKAAENAYYTQQFEQALNLYQWFETAFPLSIKASQALFMRAFIYDENLQQYEKAGQLYQAFLQKYPSDDFADDAATLLDNLGKTPEEMIQTLEDRKRLNQ